MRGTSRSGSNGRGVANGKGVGSFIGGLKPAYGADREGPGLIPDPGVERGQPGFQGARKRVATGYFALPS